MLTDLERRDIEYLLSALKRAEWSDIYRDPAKCPVCHRPRSYGHVCSCPLGLALRKVGVRLLGPEVVNAPPVSEDIVVCVGDKISMSVELLRDISQQDGMRTKVARVQRIDRYDSGFVNVHLVVDETDGIPPKEGW